jgi:hypothetical protein
MRCRSVNYFEYMTALFYKFKCITTDVFSGACNIYRVSYTTLRNPDMNMYIAYIIDDVIVSNAI